MTISKLVCLSLMPLAAGVSAPGLPRTFARWQTIELSFQGPSSRGMGSPNPFAAPLDVDFTSPGGKLFRVPAFYDGDGRGGLDGNVWRVRFSADRNGEWTWATRSAEPLLDGKRGKLRVVDPGPETSGFQRAGRLEYVGARYLKFREAGYWLKFGADDPENLLGAAFGKEDWAAKKKQIDYLASLGINSVYVMTHNVDGDGNDVWPWVGGVPEEAKRNTDRFDVAKLARWRGLFEHIQSKGIAIQIVLEDDSAWTGYDHARYYREMIARFGDLSAVYFNFCEEYNERYSFQEALGHLERLAALDPYQHPLAVHNVSQPVVEYVASPLLTVTSIQTQETPPAALNALAVAWLESCLLYNQRPLAVSFDEARPAASRKSWWSVYLGGAIWETYLPVAESYSVHDTVWRELARTRRFMEAIPAARMIPANGIVRRGTAFVLAEGSAIYALYLPEGGAIEVELPASNEYRLEWFDPAAGGVADWIPGGQVRGGVRTLSAPRDGDWAARLTRTGGMEEPAPVAISGSVRARSGHPLPFRLASFFAGEAGADYRIVKAPSHGSLSGAGAARIYSPAADYRGRDTLEWRLETNAGVSNTARIEFEVSESQINQAPVAADTTVRARGGQAAGFILAYSDPDGPGPHQIRILRQPERGKLGGKGNDRTYTPEPGFRGADVIEWQVTDRAGARSAVARVKIVVE